MIYYESKPRLNSNNSNSNSNNQSSSSSSSSFKTSSEPWLMIIHPMFLDLSFVNEFLCLNQGLSTRFNIILFDLRSHGRTSSIVSPSCDLWTLAADLALGLKLLSIDTVHLLCLDVLSTEISIRIAGLFPDLVLSSCMCNLPPATEQGFVQSAFSTVMDEWINPELPEDWEASVSATQWWLYGPEKSNHTNVRDDWAGALIRRYPPCKALDALGSCVAYTERDAPPAGLASCVTAPLLVLHGDYENIYDVSSAHSRFLEFKNVPSISKFQVLKDVPLQVFDTHPEMIKEHYYPWIDSILKSAPSRRSTPHAVPSDQDQLLEAMNPLELVDDRGDILPRQSRIREFLRSGLIRLSSLTDRPEIQDRDPSSSSSFSALSQDKIESNLERIKFLEANQGLKFSLIGGGAPEKWTGASFDEMNQWRFSSRCKVHSKGQSRNAIEEMISAITECAIEEDVEEEEGGEDQ
ncbi:hypothetical protein BY996DRAFT_6429341 [Phakopsora pachyrhizi]|nr:hypothetical protein BY996DRAFT_6429341 [Phakopsora pachyrhizi]